MEELQNEIRSQLILLVDHSKISMLQMSKDIGISYQSLRRFILEQNSNPTASSIRKMQNYLNK